MRLHPATQIVIWCSLVAALQFMPPWGLFVAGVIGLSSAFMLSRRKFVQLLRRTRWIMFSLMLIYAYTSPGALLTESLGVFSPSQEGLQDGALQLLRLLVALAGLAILLDHLHRQPLISGLYSLFAPLQWLGLSRERLAVRLALTLHYAEVAVLRSQSWRESLNGLAAERAEQNAENRDLELPVYPFTRLDMLLLVTTVLLLWRVMK